MHAQHVLQARQRLFGEKGVGGRRGGDVLEEVLTHGGDGGEGAVCARGARDVHLGREGGNVGAPLGLAVRWREKRDGAQNHL